MPKHKTTVIILSSLLTGTAIFITVVYCLFFKLPSGFIELEPTAVDNYLNNFITGGDLCQIGDKLYYNYYDNNNRQLRYGLIEISKNGSKRVDWYGPIFLKSYLGLPAIITDGNKLYRSRDCDLKNNIPKDGVSNGYYDKVFAYKNNLEFKKTHYGELNISESYSINGKLNDVLSISLTDANGKSRNIIDKKSIEYFYFTDDAVYYSDFKRMLYKTELKTGNTIKLFKLYDNEQFIVEGDKLISMGYNSKSKLYNIYVYDTSHKNSLPEVIAEYEQIFWNVYNNKIYYSKNDISSYNQTENSNKDFGIWEYDLKSGKHKKVCGEKSRNIYILDEHWIYFVVESGALCRVSNQGGKAERVFG